MSGKAYWVMSDLFWSQFLAFRICLIMGRFGGGKTALAFLMAARLLAEGHVKSIYSNIPGTFVSTVDADDFQQAGIILDEAWIYLEGRRDVLDYAGFVRKNEHFMMLPSVFPVHNRLSFFWVQRVFNAYTLGIPAWVYSWTLKQKDVKQHGYFGIWNPSAIFGSYDTLQVAGDDAGISDAIASINKAKGFKGTRSQQYTRVLVEQAGSELGSEAAVSEAASEFQDALEAAGDFTSDIETAVRRAARLRR